MLLRTWFTTRSERALTPHSKFVRPDPRATHVSSDPITLDMSRTIHDASRGDTNHACFLCMCVSECTCS
jgi:hypothetical protein